MKTKGFHVVGSDIRSAKININKFCFSIADLPPFIILLTDILAGVSIQESLNAVKMPGAYSAQDFSGMLSMATNGRSVRGAISGHMKGVWFRKNASCAPSTGRL